MSVPTAANPHTVTLCWTPDQNFGQVSVYPTRAPVNAILGLLRAGESPERVAEEHGVTADEVRLLGRLADELIPGSLEHAVRVREATPGRPEPAVP